MTQCSLLFLFDSLIILYFKYYLCNQNQKMKQSFLLLIYIALSGISAFASDSIQTKRPQFITIQTTNGFMIPTKKMNETSYKSSLYGAATLKYGIGAKGNNWKDQLYDMPYYGIGLHLPRFSERKYLGDPFSIFLFQGAELKRISPTLSFNYEINLGAAFNWKHYDPVSNSNFTALGSSTNVHLAGNWYFKWQLSHRLDLHAGINVTHFSNGATQTPNNGLNLASAYVELAYYLNREKTKSTINNVIYTPPKFEKNIAHEFMFLASVRSLKIDTVGNNMNTKFPHKKFKVAGLSYGHLFHQTRRLLWGPSIEIVYDESSNVNIWRDEDPLTGDSIVFYQSGKVKDRFSVGLSLKGELQMAGYSIFTNIGIDVINSNRRDKRFYSIYGIKLYLTENLFGTFGVRSTNFTQSQYLYVNIGYTIRHYRRKKG